jgi:RNA-directed DNA polymerase
VFEQLTSKENLHQAFRRVKANNGTPGIDGQTVEQFETQREENLQLLRRELRDETYRPQPGRRVMIPKNGTSEMRPLYIPTVKDRVVQTALLMVLEPLFEPDFAECSYGFRKGRGCHDALRQVIALLNEEYTHVVDVDIRKFFDNINHETILGFIRKKIEDEQTLRFIKATLKAGVLKGGLTTEPELGTPQGGPISPLLANTYLNPLDHLMVGFNYKMIRYADDAIILCQNHQQAKEALNKVREWLNTVGLSLHPTKSRILEVTDPGGFNFLGYRFQNNLRSPRPENVTKLKDKIKDTVHVHETTNLNQVISKIDEITRGWYQHFQLCNDPKPFQEIDYWVWLRLTAAQEEITGRNKQHQPKPLQRAPFCLTNALQKGQHWPIPTKGSKPNGFSSPFKRSLSWSPAIPAAELSKALPT